MTIAVGLSLDPGEATFLDVAREAEQIGVDSIWVPEYWAYDAFTPLAAIAAVTDRIRVATGVAQIGARSPAMLAMTALSLQHLSNGRFVLGIGTSGPQVMEGWHGVEFVRPIARTRETIEIVRTVASGERLRYDGSVYRLPLPGGEGAAIRSRAELRPVPIHVATLGPANLALTGELADGWIGNSFFPEHAEVYLGPIGRAATAAGRSIADIEIVVAVGLELTPDEATMAAAGRRHADGYAFTFGAMGSATTNFYAAAFARQGYGDDVEAVASLWRDGDRASAAARVPIEIGLGTNLIGPPEVVRDRLLLYRDAGVTTLRVNPVGSSIDERLASLATLVEMARDLDEQP